MDKTFQYVQLINSKLATENNDCSMTSKISKNVNYFISKSMLNLKFICINIHTECSSVITAH